MDIACTAKYIARRNRCKQPSPYIRIKKLCIIILFIRLSITNGPRQYVITILKTFNKH